MRILRKLYWKTNAFLALFISPLFWFAPVRCQKKYWDAVINSWNHE